MEARQTRTSGEVMKQIASGTAIFELRRQNEGMFSASSFASISLGLQGKQKGSDYCFARISPIQTPPALKKIEHYEVWKVRGDGRCMFRALAQGMAVNDGVKLNSAQEKSQADDLRMSVREAICLDKQQQHKYEEALIAITIDESINRYCTRIKNPDFWGGEAELLVLSKMYEQPIIVYIPETEAKSLWGTGYVPIAEYGLEYTTTTKDREGCKPVRLLYSSGNHYDLLI